MRGCLSVLALAAVFAFVAAWFGAPALAGYLVEGALTGAGVGGRGTSVAVAADPPLEVLTGHADQVTIGTNDATYGRLAATRVDLVLHDVDLLARSFGTVDGRLEGVRVRQDDTVVRIRRIDLLGPASATGAVATLPGADVERLATAAINDRFGLPIASGQLVAPDLLRVSVAGRDVDARFVVEPDGSLSLALPLAGEPRVPLVANDPMRFGSATVEDGDLVLRGTLDLAALIGG